MYIVGSQYKANSLGDNFSKMYASNMATLSNSKHYAFSIKAETLNEFVRSSVMVSFAAEILHILRLILLITSLVGFGFYLWFLYSINDQTQRRFLNILNGYLSVACMGFSPFAYIYDYMNKDVSSLAGCDPATNRSRDTIIRIHTSHFNLSI